MLPSLGFSEIMILGILALVVVGPKDLPLLLRKLGRWTAKLRGMAQEFRSGFDELARQAELDELKKEVDALRRNTVLSDLSRELQKPLPTLEDYATGKPAPPALTPAQLAPPPSDPAPAKTEAADTAIAEEPAPDLTPENDVRAEDAPLARTAP